MTPSPHPAIRILLVEDNPGDARLIVEALRDVAPSGFVVTVVKRLSAAIEHLRGGGADVVLLDLGLPDSVGLDTFERTRNASTGEPIVITSGLDDERIALEAVRAGAQDYLVKGRLDGELLARVIRYSIERKRAEETQRASEAQYRTLFECAPDGIVIADPRGYYVDVNASLCRMLGYTGDELIGRHASDLVDLADAPHIASAISEMTGVADHEREWRFRRKDQSTFVADVIATLMPDGNLLGMIRDVTERHQALEALRTAEERMRFALQNANVGVWDMDYVTGRLQWSGTIEAHYGLRPGSFVGTFDAFMERVHPDDRAALTETVGQAMKTGVDFTTEHRALWPDGTVRWLSGAGRVLLGEHGEPLRGIGISLDVTERRSLEAQYQQAQKMEAIGQLAGGIAHDFNNLLTIILGHARFIEETAADDYQRRDVAAILTAGQRAAGLTRQLLTFSRKQARELSKFDLNSLIHGIVGMLRRLIGENIVLKTTLSESALIIENDRGQVEQVLMNLVVNARDAMPAGGVVTIATDIARIDETDWVRLTVSDLGTGMSDETKAQIFEPFFTTKAVGHGTGLGLATVFSIVNQSRGQILVDSEVGKGTTFKILLPRDAAVTVTTVPAEPRIARGDESILVVEDDDAIRDLMREVLTRSGYNVEVAVNPAEARVIANRRTFDLLLTDVLMPGGTGPDLYIELAARYRQLRVLYVSGYAPDPDLSAKTHDGLAGFLGKPFAPNALTQKIREVLER